MRHVKMIVEELFDNLSVQNANQHAQDEISLRPLRQNETCFELSYSAFDLRENCSSLFVIEPSST